MLRKTLPSRLRPALIFEVHERPSPRRAAILRHVDGLVCISESLHASLADLGLAGIPVAVQHDGVDRAPFDEERLSAREARLRLGLEVGGSVVCYVGALHDDEVQILLAAGEQLRNASIRMLIVGGTPQQVSRYRTQARARSVNADFVGFVDHALVPRYMQAADVLVMPYTGTLRWSAHFSPLKLFEYMAAGRPLVASDLPVLREVITDGWNAVIVRPGDADSLVSGIRRVLSDAELRSNISAAALQDVAKYTWDTRARKIVSFIDRLSDNALA